MHVPRIYYPGQLATSSVVKLNAASSRHVLLVLRLKINAPVILFNGKSGEFKAHLFSVDKQVAVVKIDDFVEKNVESPLRIHLGQALTHGDKMDLIIQKAVELGVCKITPLITEFCNVKFNASHLEKKQQHWRLIAINACEQSGRNIIPIIRSPQSLAAWASDLTNERRLVCHPYNAKSLDQYQQNTNDVALLVGPEGGLGVNEVKMAHSHKFQNLSLGPRILRMETAAITAVSILQSVWGDI